MMIDVDLIPLPEAAPYFNDEILDTIKKCQDELQGALIALYEAGILVRITYKPTH